MGASLANVLSLGSKKPEDVLDVFNAACELPLETSHRRVSVRITPEIAATWLRRNRANRKVREGVVSRYTNDILAGAWKETDESIKFSKTGALIDGQHRLLAIVKAGLALKLSVSVGLSDDVFDVLDTGASRTGKDVLAIQGLASWDSNTAAAAIQMLLNDENDLPPSSSTRYSNQEVLAWWLDHPSFADTITYLSTMPRGASAITHSVGAFLHFVFSQIDVELADSFIEQLFRGEGLVRTHPVYQLRHKLLANKLAGNAPTRQVQIHASYNAWNLLRSKKPAAGTRGIMPRSDQELPELL